MRVARIFLIVVSVVNGLLGIVCAVLLFVQPDGRFLQAGALLPVIKTLPLASVFFQDFRWIGVAMLLVLGIPNTIAAVMLLRRSKKQYLATLGAAVLLVLWCSFELLYMFNGAAVGYFVVGVISFACSVALMKPAAPADA